MNDGHKLGSPHPTEKVTMTHCCTSQKLSRHRNVVAIMLASCAVLLSGCLQGIEKASSLGFYEDSSINFAAYNPPQSKIDTGKTTAQRLADLGSDSVGGLEQQIDQQTTVRAQSPQTDDFSGGFGFPAGSRTLFGGTPSNQSDDRNQFDTADDQQNRPAVKKSSAAGRVAQRFQAKADRPNQPNGSVVRLAAGTDSTAGAVSNAGLTQNDDGEQGKVKGVAFRQYPELNTPDRWFVPGNGIGSPNIGAPNELNSAYQPFEVGGNAPIPFPVNYADLDVFVNETDTGRINFGGAFNSDNGIVGQFSIDERNFDIRRFPRSFRELFDGTAFRGGGQQFRLELVPGQVVQRYSVSLTEPFLLGSDYSLSVSGYLFDRRFFDWDEQRLGGRVALGRRLTPDLSFSLALRGEQVTIDNPRADTSPTLNAALGSSDLFVSSAALIRDTRDSRVAATEGTFFSATLSQAFGDFSYTRGEFDFRTYRLLYQRADGSGRHTISYGTKLGFSGSDTPVFENFIAGGFSTFRGFDFRGVGPSEGSIRIGGEFQWLNTVEYQFPLTADDALKGVLFCDFGTVEESVEIQSENFRVAPGFGLRVSVPGIGGGAPLAFDFAFPVATAEGDEEQVFTFSLGLNR